MAIVVALVGVTGWLAYERFTGIVDSISEEARPDMQLVAMEQVLTNLSQAENSVKSYSLTRKDEYLTEFYETAQETDTQMQRLQGLLIEDELAIANLDSLSVLVDQKFQILNDLLVLQDKFRVQQALDKVLARIEQQAGEEDTASVAMDTTVVAEQKTEENEKKGFLWGIFKKKEKNEQEPVADSQLESEVPDTAKIEEQVSISAISEAAEEIRQEEAVIDARLKQRELALIQEDQLVMTKIHSLFETMKREEMEILELRADQADKEVRDTNRIIAGFCIVAAILLILAAIIISTYVRNNRRYRRALGRAKTKAEELAMAKERFLANMSHEIRTPMNAIAGFSEQLSQSKLSSEQKEQVDIVRKSADHLLHIVNDVLDLTKLRSGRLKLESIPFGVTDITNEVIKLMEPAARDKDINLESEVIGDVPEVVIGDPFRLRQALLNLVGNAVKFTHEGSVTMTVAVERKTQKRSYVQFTVADTGVGIEEGHLNKIFEEFEQGETNTTRNYGGTGLGLAITRKLVEAHRGEINIDSQIGKGTTVSFSIPYKNSSRKSTETESTERAVLVPEGLRILVVDDEPFNRKLLTAILNKHGIEFQEAENGEDGLHLLAEHHFDVILMDARMPKLTGVEATRRIRALGNPVPVIALTAAVNEEDRIQYKEAGMDAVLSKPFKEHQLLQIIQRVLEEREKVGDSGTFSENGDGQFDPSELEQMSGGDDAFYKDMLETFVHSAEDGIEKIEHALQEGNWKEISEAAHKLCPPCRHLKADRLLAHLKEIEKKSLILKDRDQLEPLVAKTKAEMEAVVSKIKELPILNRQEA